MWDRKLIETVFGFRYRWEVYTPASKRQFGYYTLPIVYGDGFAGRVEAAADVKGGIMRVKNVWFEDGVRRTKKLEAAIRSAAGRLAKFNGCREIKYPEG
jgi:uncharacterized protein YcaQ